MSNKLDQQMSDEANQEIAEIRALDPDPIEAMYKWIDRECSIPDNAALGGYFTAVDALPVYVDLATGKFWATAVPMVPMMLRGLKRPLFVGLAQYNTADDSFLRAIPLRAFQRWGAAAFAGMKESMQEAFDTKDAAYKMYTRRKVQ